MRQILIITCLLLLSNFASAHYVWLEHDSGQPAKLFFGEWHKNEREEGDKLDRFSDAKIFLTDPQQALKHQRELNHIAASAPNAGDVRTTVNSAEARENKRTGGFSKSHYYAKAGRLDTTAAMQFEMVPTAANGNTMTLLFNHKALPGTEVTVYGPPKWQQTKKTNKDGQIIINTPWAGTYLIKTRHEIAPEEGLTSAQAPALRYNLTWTFIVNEGIEWQDAEPAAKHTAEMDAAH